MSSSEPWHSFFIDAGIPSASAKNYGAVFDDNRITKEMLLDLDKEILKEMGITLVGDIIAILKHAKKVYSKELKKKDSSVLSSGANKSQLVKVAPLTNTAAVTPSHTKHQSQTVVSPPSPDSNKVIKQPRSSTVISISPQTPPKKGTSATWSNPTSSPLGSISTDVQYTTATYKNQQKQHQKISAQEPEHSTDIPQYGSSLHSDKLISAATSRSSTNMVMEEYTTSTYEERMKKKRAISQVVTQTTPPSRVTVVIPSLPQEKRTSYDKTVDRSKRLLEAAGIIDSTDFSDSFPKQTTQSSVFSRLELSGSKSNPEVTKRSPTNIKSRLGKRVVSKSEADLSNNGSGPVSKTPSLYSDDDHGADIHDRLGSNKESDEAASTSIEGTGTMVADSISRHSDVHARLKKRGVSLPTGTRSGPLGKRLGRHAVFGRLE